MIITCAEELCALFRNERKERGLSQEKFGALVGHHQHRVSTYERGPRAMPLRTAIRVLRRLGYEVHIVKAPAGRTL